MFSSFFHLVSYIVHYMSDNKYYMRLYMIMNTRLLVISNMVLYTYFLLLKFIKLWIQIQICIISEIQKVKPLINCIGS